MPIASIAACLVHIVSENCQLVYLRERQGNNEALHQPRLELGALGNTPATVLSEFDIKKNLRAVLSLLTLVYCILWSAHFTWSGVNSVCLQTVREGMTQHTTLMTNSLSAEDRGDSVRVL